MGSVCQWERDEVRMHHFIHNCVFVCVCVCLCVWGREKDVSIIIMFSIHSFYVRVNLNFTGKGLPAEIGKPFLYFHTLTTFVLWPLMILHSELWTLYSELMAFALWPRTLNTWPLHSDLCPLQKWPSLWGRRRVPSTMCRGCSSDQTPPSMAWLRLSLSVQELHWYSLSIYRWGRSYLQI